MQSLLSPLCPLKYSLKPNPHYFPLLERFSDQCGLVGGTAIALHLGHRRSLDFDLFSAKTFDHAAVRNIIRQEYPIQKTLIDSQK